MTPDFRPSPIERLVGADLVREFLHKGLTAPAVRAARSRMVIEIVAHLHDTLTDSLITEAEAYETFVRGNLDLERAPSRREETMTDDRALDAGPVVRFSDAEKINPFQVLIELHDHALRQSSGSSRAEVLTELALAAVLSWWSRWQPITIHRALRCGADLADIAEATGLDPGEVVRRWERWSDVQNRFSIGRRLSVDPVEVRTIRERIRAE